MKIYLSFFLSTIFLINSCNTNSDKKFRKFTLEGEISGQDTGKIVLIYMPDKTRIYDTAKIENGRFLFIGKIFEPTNVLLEMGDGMNGTFFYLEPGNMKIFLSKDKPEEYKIVGSKTQDDFDLLEKMITPFYDQRSSLSRHYNNISDSLKITTNISFRIVLAKKAEEIEKLRSQIKKQLDSTVIKFVMENPKSFLAVVQLRELVDNEVISLDSAKLIFNLLDNSLRKSSNGHYIIEDMRKKENIRIGNQAPDFKAIDINNKIVTLSQFKGRSVILLDFWASWCVPCRQSIPHLKNLYEKYHSKGLELIAVSKDDDRKAWIEAVNQDSTNLWYHIPVAQRYAEGLITNDDIYHNYFVQSIPIQILIDKNGKIIGRFKGASKANEESLDRLLSKVFDN